MTPVDITFGIVIGLGILFFAIFAVFATFIIWSIFSDKAQIDAINQVAVNTSILSQDKVADKTETDEKKLSRNIDSRATKYLSIPSIAPHYINRIQVAEFYTDNFRNPTIENLVSEVTGEISSELQGKIPQIAESRIGGKDIKKLTSTMKMPDISPNSMFLQYQKEMISNSQVALGLEEIEIELTELQEFDATLLEFEKKFGFKLESSTIDEYKMALRNKAASKTIEKLEKTLSWVLLDGKFKITKENESYKCIFNHPINEYLSQEDEYILFTFLVPAKDLEDNISENYSQSIGSQIPLRVYGRVWQPINRKDKVWELKIIPMCVY